MAMKLALDQKHNWRLKFHLQTAIGWMSDPNGLCQFNGEYHVFFQYSPRWPVDVHGWGHWVSKDLLTWTFLGRAIFPDMELDAHGSYSGSTLVRDGQMWCYYTGNVLDEGDYDFDFEGRHANEMLTISEDGRNFSEKRCVVPERDYPSYCSNHVRDPFVWKQNDAYYMLLGLRTNKDRGGLLLYESTDGLSWKQAGSCTNLSERPFGYMWECPGRVEIDGKEFLMLCPQGVPKQDFSYQNIFNAGYFALEESVIELMGKDAELAKAKSPHPSLDEKSFVEFDWGFDFYAPQVFKDEQGRNILIAWVGLPDIDTQYDVPTREWSHTLTVPRELSVNAAGRLCQAPVAELSELHGEELSFSREAASGSTGYTGTSHCDMYEVGDALATLSLTGTADIVARGIEGEGHILLGSDVELMLGKDCLELVFLSPAGRYRSLRRLPYSALSAGKVENLRLLVDSSCIEVFVNDGEATLTSRFFPLDISKLAIVSNLEAKELKAWTMNSYELVDCG